MQVPECEVLMPRHAVKNFIRRGEFFKIVTAMETGADQGMWTYQRYRTWLESRKNWHMPGQQAEEEPAGELPVMEEMKAAPPPMSRTPASSAPPTTKSAPGRVRRRRRRFWKSSRKKADWKRLFPS